MKYEQLIQMVENWLEDRPTMKENNTPRMLATLLLGEVNELIEAYEEGDEDEISSELADVGIFLISLLNVLGLDMYSVIADKMAFNHARYPSHMFSNGYSYEEARKMCKGKEYKVRKDFYGKKGMGIPQESKGTGI